MQNYFELFSMSAEFSIDLAQLESTYQTQIAKFHPDKFTTHAAQEKSAALQNSSLINAAYDVLKSPLLRATYLLELQGINAFDEKDTQMNVDFLMEQIEHQEHLDDIKSTQDALALDDFIQLIDGKIKRNIEQIQALFANDELDEVKNLVRELKFYEQLNTHAKQLMDEWL